MAQYQHYIPQFLLRNFSHPYKPPKASGTKKRSKFRTERGKHKGDKVLNVVDLVSNEPRLLELPVSRCFGQEDMYKDFTDAIRSKKEVEQELSKLESRTAEILLKVKKAYDHGEKGIWLTRRERNKLRKFLFIMKYRGPAFYEKYAKEPKTYDAEDKHVLRTYMTENGFANPRDVWLHNLRVILDIEMDVEKEWVTKLPKLMFPEDAQMFIVHTEFSYVAFCATAEERDEFLLTDQCYSIFEGPNNETFCARTGEYLGDTYLCYHEFGPISSRLIIILRSLILPEAVEDMNPRIQEARLRRLEAVAVQFPDPKNIKSILYDLPVAKAMNSYTRLVDGRLESIPGWSGKSRPDDKFCFRFWPISTKHVDIINSIFLDNLLICKNIVFDSTVPFQRTLEAYMTTTSIGFKQVGVGEHGARVDRLSVLEKLSDVLKILGSTVTPVWSNIGGNQLKPFFQSFDDIWLEMMKRILDHSNESSLQYRTSPFWQTYYQLEGTSRTFAEDLDQSWRLYRLQALAFSLIKNMSGGPKRKAYMNLLACILQNLPRRVWMYVKHRRWMLSKAYAKHQEIYVGAASLYAAKTEAFFRAEPEDDVVRANLNTDYLRLSTLIFAAGTSSTSDEEDLAADYKIAQMFRKL